MPPSLCQGLENIVAKFRKVRPLFPNSKLIVRVSGATFVNFRGRNFRKYTDLDVWAQYLKGAEVE